VLRYGNDTLPTLPAKMRWILVGIFSTVLFVVGWAGWDLLRGVMLAAGGGFYAFCMIQEKPARAWQMVLGFMIMLAILHFHNTLPSLG
jgi:hypothetical protein